MKSAKQILLFGMLAAAVMAVTPSARAQIQTTGTPGSPGATTGFPRRRVVVLPDPRGSITVLSQYFRNSPSTLRNDAGVAVIAGGEFGDNSSSGDVVITAC